MPVAAGREQTGRGTGDGAPVSSAWCKPVPIGPGSAGTSAFLPALSSSMEPPRFLDRRSGMSLRESEPGALPIRTCSVVSLPRSAKTL